eukprot:1944980-Amphidinium_carterae.1
MTLPLACCLPQTSDADSYTRRKKFDPSVQRERIECVLAPACLPFVEGVHLSEQHTAKVFDRCSHADIGRILQLAGPGGEVGQTLYADIFNL